MIEDVCVCVCVYRGEAGRDGNVGNISNCTPHAYAYAQQGTARHGTIHPARAHTHVHVDVDWANPSPSPSPDLQPHPNPLACTIQGSSPSADLVPAPPPPQPPNPSLYNIRGLTGRSPSMLHMAISIAPVSDAGTTAIL